MRVCLIFFISLQLWLDVLPTFAQYICQIVCYLLSIAEWIPFLDALTVQRKQHKSTHRERKKPYLFILSAQRCPSINTPVIPFPSSTHIKDPKLTWITQMDALIVAFNKGQKYVDAWISSLCSSEQWKIQNLTNLSASRGHITPKNVWRSEAEIRYLRRLCKMNEACEATSSLLRGFEIFCL